MRRLMHHRSPPSMVVAVAALFVALGGVGYAAVGLIPGPDGVIHSCYQKAGGNLRVVPAGVRCRKGEKGLAFNQHGPHGKRGPMGPAGPLVTTLPSGQSLRGWFNLDTVAAVADQINGGAIAFGFSLARAPTVQIVPMGGPTTAQCAGNVAAPSAAAGYLCLYESGIDNLSNVAVCNSSGNCPGADPFGAEVFVHSTATGRFFVDGTWAVTAP